MGKTIEVRLSDAQHAALTAEAEASGTTFFGYCRAKLTADATAQHYGTSPAAAALPVIRADNERKRAEARDRETERRPVASAADDRIARIEDAVARLTDFVLQGQTAPDQEQPQQADAPIDVDSLVDAQFAQAEAAGLTEHVPDVDEEVMQHAGVRPLSRRPTPFSANSAPKHLQQLLG